MNYSSTKQIAVIFLSISLLAGGCLPRSGSSDNSSNTEAPATTSNSQPSGEVVSSSDGTSQITLPPGWKEAKDLNDAATIQATKPRAEMYAIVITDSKEDFQDIDLKKHSEITRENIVKGLQSPQVVNPTELTIDGNPALQHQISGTIETVNVVYLHTSIETPKHFHQVLTWTLKSQFEKNRAELEQVTQSLKPID